MRFLGRRVWRLKRVTIVGMMLLVVICVSVLTGDDDAIYSRDIGTTVTLWPPCLRGSGYAVQQGLIAR